MSIYDIISFIIVSSSVVLGQVQSLTGERITLEQYLGIRYIIAIAIIDSTNPPLSCGWMNVTRKDGVGDEYTASIWMQDNEEWYLKKNEGVMVDSELTYTVSSAIDEEFMCTVYGYDNGRELIIFPKNHSFTAQFALLTSPNQMISNNARDAFTDMCKREHLRVVFITHAGCSYV